MSTVCIDVFALLHVPPVVLFASVVLVPGHALVVPVMFAGVVLTVTTIVDLHPPLTVYVIVVVPAAIPVTTPVLRPTVATLVALLAYVPPDVELLMVVDEPVQTLAVPESVPAPDVIVTVVVRAQPVASV
jgi:hypothetical protein